jgi:hypothetical protein
MLIVFTGLLFSACFLNRSDISVPFNSLSKDDVRILEIGDVIYEKAGADFSLKYIYSGRTLDNILWILKHTYSFKDDADFIRTIETPLRTSKGDNGVYLSLAGNYIVYISVQKDDKAIMKVMSEDDELAKIKNVEFDIGQKYNVNIGENIYSVIKDEYAHVFTYCGLTKENKIWILDQKYYYGSDIIESDIKTIELTQQTAEKFKLTDKYFLSINVGEMQRLIVKVIYPY